MGLRKEGSGVSTPSRSLKTSDSEFPATGASRAHPRGPREIDLLLICHQTCVPERSGLSQLTLTFRLSGKQSAFPATLSLVFPFMLVTQRGEKRQPTSVNLVPQPHTHPTTTCWQSHQSESLSWELCLNTRPRWGESAAGGGKRMRVTREEKGA